MFGRLFVLSRKGHFFGYVGHGEYIFSFSKRRGRNSQTKVKFPITSTQCGTDVFIIKGHTHTHTHTHTPSGRYCLKFSIQSMFDFCLTIAVPASVFLCVPKLARTQTHCTAIVIMNVCVSAKNSFCCKDIPAKAGNRREEEKDTEL